MKKSFWSEFTMLLTQWFSVNKKMHEDHLIDFVEIECDNDTMKHWIYVENIMNCTGWNPKRRPAHTVATREKKLTQ